MYDAIDIAKYIINLCTSRGTPISDLQLQKILYYIQINFFRNYGKAAFENQIEAWQYGPVVPDVYELFGVYGAAKICKFYVGIERWFSDAEKKLIEKVVDACLELTAWELVEKSHRVGGPWEATYQRGRKVEIPIEKIKEYALSEG